MYENISKERLEKILDNLIGWAVDHDDEFVECFVKAMDLTKEEVKEFELEEYADSDEE